MKLETMFAWMIGGMFVLVLGTVHFHSRTLGELAIAWLAVWTGIGLREMSKV